MDEDCQELVFAVLRCRIHVGQTQSVFGKQIPPAIGREDAMLDVVRAFELVATVGRSENVIDDQCAAHGDRVVGAQFKLDVDRSDAYGTHARNIQRMVESQFFGDEIAEVLDTNVVCTCQTESMASDCLHGEEES